MEHIWCCHDQDGVVAAWKRGERPDLATTMSSGPLDELAGLHEELGIFATLDALPTRRQRGGVDDDLLLRTLGVLPFVETASLSGAAAIGWLGLRGNCAGGRVGR